MFHVEHCALNINGRFSRLPDCREWVARPFFFLNPFLFITKDVEQQHLVLCLRQILFAMLCVRAVVEWLTGFTVKFFLFPTADAAVELHVWGVKLLLSRLKIGVKAV